MKKFLYFFSFLFAWVGISFLIIPQKSEAVSASDWMPGRIADDAVFFNSYTMNAQDIQVFLNAKVPVCDTWHARTSSANDSGPPYTCLKDFSQDIPSKSPDSYCSGAITAGRKTAAQIINDVAKACNVNPQTLIVLLQKEQSLITDTWPWNIQYRSATGYGCPDTAPCDAEYYGFFNQVYNAARQFQRYVKLANNYNYAVGRTSFVQYNPNSGCGGSNIYMQTQATAALYNYTPYQPNGAALTNLYGTGNGCSAYGNRNFWRIFHDWFGSPYRVNGTINLSQGFTLSASGTKYIGDTVTATYVVENTATYDVYVGGLGVCGRINGQFYDFGFIHHNSIPAGGTKTISFSKKLDTAGTLNVFLCSYYEGIGGWASDRYPYDSASPLPRQATLTVADNPLIFSGIVLGPANPGIQQPVTAYITVKNASEVAINIGSMVVAARDPLGRNVDFPIVNDVVIPANGGTYSYSQSRVFTSPGNYSFHVATWNGVWRTDYPKSVPGAGVIRQLNWPILDNPLITSGISLTPTNPAVGQEVTAEVTFRNVSSSPINIGSFVVAGRDPAGKNVDFPIQNDVVIPAGGTYTYSKKRTFTGSGNYTFYMANWNGVWRTDYPKVLNGSINRQLIKTIN